MGINLGVLAKKGFKLDARFNNDGIFDAIGRHTFTKKNNISDPLITDGVANFVGNNNYLLNGNQSDFSFGLNDFEITLYVKVDGNAENFSSVFDIYRNNFYNDTQRLGMYLEQGTRKVNVYGYGGVLLIAGTFLISMTDFTKISLKRTSGVLGLYFDDFLDSSVNSNVNMSSIFDVRIGGSPSEMVSPQNENFVGKINRFYIKSNSYN